MARTREFGGELIFRISVSVSAKAVAVTPDPAVVDLGAIVEWHIATQEISLARAEVYFDHGSPFEQPTLRTKLSPGDVGVVSLRANREGDYKYGVRAFDSEQNKRADEDPRLIVRRRG